MALRHADQPVDDALLLLLQRLAAREAPVLARALPGGPQLRPLALDVVEQPVLPLADVVLGEAHVVPRRQADRLGDDLGSLTGAHDRAGPQCRPVALGGDLGQLARLLDAARVERHDPLALEAPLGVVVGLPVSGEEDHGVWSAPTVTTITASVPAVASVTSSIGATASLPTSIVRAIWRAVVCWPCW